MPIRATWLAACSEGTAVGPSDGDELDVRLSRSGNDVVVRGTLAADLVVPCSRCLEPATVLVREEVSLLAVPSASTPRDGQDTTRPTTMTRPEGIPDEADIIAYDGETLVLDDLVRDELLLGIPMIPLLFGEHAQEVSGLSVRLRATPQGPEEDAIDPRLRPLLRLKNKT